MYVTTAKIYQIFFAEGLYKIKFSIVLVMGTLWVVFRVAALSGSLFVGGSGATVCSDNIQARNARVVPYPKSLIFAPFATTCVQSEQGFAYDNSNFSDGNGPRGAMNASDCCAQVWFVRIDFVLLV